MPNPLDPIWQSYTVVQDSIGVVRRTLIAGGGPPMPLTGSQFAGLTAAAVATLLDGAEEAAGEQAVMFLYAAFEATLRTHLMAQGTRLRWTYLPNAQFGVDLQDWFERLCRTVRMDDVAKLFDAAVKPVNPNWSGVIGTIRTYRHWLAHGKRGLMPAAITPLFAYQFLSQFLTACGLA